VPPGRVTVPVPRFTPVKVKGMGRTPIAVDTLMTQLPLRCGWAASAGAASETAIKRQSSDSRRLAMATSIDGQHPGYGPVFANAIGSPAERVRGGFACGTLV